MVIRICGFHGIINLIFSYIKIRARGMGKKLKSKPKNKKSKTVKVSDEVEEIEDTENRDDMDDLEGIEGLEEEEGEQEPKIEISFGDIHVNLKILLGEWVAKCQVASEFPLGEERLKAIESFCSNFVPADVNEDEMKEYAKSLADDAEFFQSLRRELGQCLSGEGVDLVTRNEAATVVEFTLLPPNDIETELDLVRELCFVTTNGGQTWTAEG